MNKRPASQQTSTTVTLALPLLYAPPPPPPLNSLLPSRLSSLTSSGLGESTCFQCLVHPTSLFRSSCLTLLDSVALEIHILLETYSSTAWDKIITLKCTHNWIGVGQQTIQHSVGFLTDRVFKFTLLQASSILHGRGTEVHCESHSPDYTIHLAKASCSTHLRYELLIVS